MMKRAIYTLAAALALVPARSVSSGSLLPGLVEPVPIVAPTPTILEEIVMDVAPVPRPMAIGKPNRGRLENGIQILEDNPCLNPTRPERSYATQELLDVLIYGACAMKQKYDTKLTLWDLSRQGGGRLSVHASHQNGRDADFSPYMIINGKLESKFPNNKRGNRGNRGYDKQSMLRNWELVVEFQRSGYPLEVFWHESLVGTLRSHIIDTYGREEWQRHGSVFRACNSRPKAYCEGHRDHMHLRVLDAGPSQQYAGPLVQDEGRKN